MPKSAESQAAIGDGTPAALANTIKDKSAYHGVRAVRNEPRHVTACKNQSWRLLTFDGDTGEQCGVYAYRCGSWRHPGPCQRHEASVAFARIFQAAQRFPLAATAFSVLTYDQQGRKGGMRHDGPQAAVAHAPIAFREYLRRMRRRFGRVDYVATLECHRNNWPHFNLLLFGDGLERVEWLDSSQIKWLQNLQIDCGFGPVVLPPQRPRSTGAVSGYVVKTARMQVTAEVTKGSQLPMSMPPRTRRVRSSRGFLPPREQGDGTVVAILETDPLALPALTWVRKQTE